MNGELQAYKHFSHEPIMTVKESKSIQEKLFGKTKRKGHIKNLHLRDKKKKQYFISNSSRHGC